MTTRISLQPAFVLHTRPYRDTSLLVELLTYRHGRVCAVARSARRSRSRFSAVLRSFDTILVSWTGSGDLVTLTQAEHTGMVCDLNGKSLVCGLYMNELLVRLLSRYDPCTEIFSQYQKTIAALVSRADQAMLRTFELHLLRAIGYGLNCDTDAESGQPIVADRWYRYQADRGFTLVPDEHPQADALMGYEITAIGCYQLDSEAQCAVAKRITRAALSHVLSHKPIRSRELFTSLYHREETDENEIHS